MNLQDQIGQLFMLGLDGTAVSPEWAGLQARYKPGGMILFARNLEQPAQVIELTNSLQACSPHFPLLIAIDQEGGRVSRLPEGFTIFPPCGVLGACRSEELAYAAASVTAAELRAGGVNMNMRRCWTCTAIRTIRSSATGPTGPSLILWPSWDWRPSAGCRARASSPAANIFPGTATPARTRTRIE